MLPIPPERVAIKGRLQPGRMFLVDMEQGRIVADDEIKAHSRPSNPMGVARQAHLVDLEDAAGANLPPPITRPCSSASRRLVTRSKTCACCSRRWPRMGVEPVGSMGTDIPLAVLSDKPKLLYDYFKQLFAQVTNPPIDCIREELVTSGGDHHRSRAQPAQARPESCRLSSE